MVYLLKIPIPQPLLETKAIAPGAPMHLRDIHPAHAAQAAWLNQTIKISKLWI